jgi:hypothetical protein
MQQGPEQSAPKKDRHGFRSVPPPPRFSLAEIPDDTLLTETEVAGFLRVAKCTVAEWRRHPHHPLKWLLLPNGRVRSTAGSVRAYLAAGRREAGRGRQS